MGRPVVEVRAGETRGHDVVELDVDQPRFVEEHLQVRSKRSGVAVADDQHLRRVVLARRSGLFRFRGRWGRRGGRCRWRRRVDDRDSAGTLGGGPGRLRWRWLLAGRLRAICQGADALDGAEHDQSQRRDGPESPHRIALLADRPTRSDILSRRGPLGHRRCMVRPGCGGMVFPLVAHRHPAETGNTTK